MNTRTLTLLVTIATLTAQAAPPVRITVQPSKVRQEFQGLGCGAMFYEGHITSLAARQKDDRQRELYDDMFTKVNTRYLNLMIRATHEPANDNADPAIDADHLRWSILRRKAGTHNLTSSSKLRAT